MSDKYQGPKVIVGDTVHWYHGTNDGKPDGTPHTAFVTEVCGNGQLALAILEKDNHGLKVPESAVRHIGDPLSKKSLEIDPELGVWDFPPDRLSYEEIAELRILLAPSKPNPVFGASPRPKNTTADAA